LGTEEDQVGAEPLGGESSTVAPKSTTPKKHFGKISLGKVAVPRRGSPW